MTLQFSVLWGIFDPVPAHTPRSLTIIVLLRLPPCGKAPKQDWSGSPVSFSCDLPDALTMASCLKNGDWIQARDIFNFLLPAHHLNELSAPRLTGKLIEGLNLMDEALRRPLPRAERMLALACVAYLYRQAFWETAPDRNWFPAHLSNWVPLLVKTFPALTDDQPVELPPEARPVGHIPLWTGRDLALSPVMTLGLMAHTLFDNPQEACQFEALRLLRFFHQAALPWQWMSVAAGINLAVRHFSPARRQRWLKSGLRNFLLSHPVRPLSPTAPAKPLPPSSPLPVPANPEVVYHPTDRALPTDLCGFIFLWSLPPSAVPGPLPRLYFATGLRPGEVVETELVPSSRGAGALPILHPIRILSWHEPAPSGCPLTASRTDDRRQADFETALRRMLLG
jgi:hypothetical protein